MIIVGVMFPFGVKLGGKWCKSFEENVGSDVHTINVLLHINFGRPRTLKTYQEK